MTGRAYLAWLLVGVSGWGCSFDRSGLPGEPDGGDGPATAGPLEVGEARLLYAEVGNSRVRSLHLADGQARRETSTPASADQAPRWVLVEPLSGEEDELAVIAYPDAGGGTVLAAFTGGPVGWRLEWSETVSTQMPGRAFDLESEASGDVLLVYADGPAARYRVYVGGAWSEPMPVPLPFATDPELDAIRFVELEGRSISDQIALGFAADDDLVVTTWDGAVWSTEPELLELELAREPGTAEVHNRAFDLAWENLSGALLVAWGADQMDGFYYAVQGTSGTWNPARQHRPGNVRGKPRFVDLSSQPGSDRVAAGLFDIGENQERLGVAVWDGVQWGGIEADDQMREWEDAGVGRYAGAVGWFGSEALCVYPDAETGALSWARWRTGTWMVGEDVPVDGMGLVESMLLASTPDGLWVVMLDDAGKLHALVWDGALWTAPADGALLAGMVPFETLTFALAAKER